MILLSLKALAGGKVELVAAIGTEQKPGEQSLPFRFSGAAFVFAQLLYSVPLCLGDDGFLCVLQNIHILRVIGKSLFELEGFGVGLEITGAACVLNPFQNTDHRIVIPTVGVFR